jgi:mannose/fructose/N-acetylgalactosamine-specific phosphotransferase system component IID
VGALLALPGAVGGLLLALALPPALVPLLLLAGAFTGYKVGFKMENR